MPRRGSASASLIANLSLERRVSSYSRPHASPAFGGGRRGGRGSHGAPLILRWAPPMRHLGAASCSQRPPAGPGSAGTVACNPARGRFASAWQSLRGCAWPLRGS
eukprot:4177-Alexandrium_andersonii.AAC.1